MHRAAGGIIAILVLLLATACTTSPPAAPLPDLPAFTEATAAQVADEIMITSRPDRGARVPESVRERLSVPIGVADRGPEGRLRVVGLADYAAVAALLGHATVTGGVDFTRDLGTSAIRVKQAGNRLADDEPASTRDELVAVLERPVNEMLAIVARDAAASQALLDDPDGRRSLLGCGWTDGSGAAAVLRAATAPMQATADLTAAAAGIAGTVRSELGADPGTWRSLIPRTGALAAALGDLITGHIDDALADPAAWEGYLRFVATGADPAAPVGDRDVQRIRAAADLHTVGELTEAVRRGGLDGRRDLLRHALALHETVFRTQFEALVDQDVAPGTAAAAAFYDHIVAADLIGRLAAAGPAAGPLATGFRAAFDRAVVQVPGPAREPPLPGRPADYFRADRDVYPAHRDQLVVAALARAGALPADLRAGRLFGQDGALRTLTDVRDEQDALTALADLARSGPAGIEGWAGLLTASPGGPSTYDPSAYAGTDRRTALDDTDERDLLRYGPSR